MSSDDGAAKEGWESHISDEEMRGIIKSLAKEEEEVVDVPKKADPRCAKAKFIFLGYCEDSTTHGFNHIGAAHTKAVVMFWTILLLLAGCGAAYLLYGALLCSLRSHACIQTRSRLTSATRRRFKFRCRTTSDYSHRSPFATSARTSAVGWRRLRCCRDW